MYYFCLLILVIKLALLEGDICKYLLNSLLFMQFAMGLLLILPDVLLIWTEINEDWGK